MEIIVCLVRILRLFGRVGSRKIRVCLVISLVCWEGIGSMKRIVSSDAG